eukprot:278381-Chlamydomonas_euryale.AAC.4
MHTTTAHRLEARDAQTMAPKQRAAMFAACLASPKFMNATASAWMSGPRMQHACLTALIMSTTWTGMSMTWFSSAGINTTHHDVSPKWPTSCARCKQHVCVC